MLRIPRLSLPCPACSTATSCASYLGKFALVLIAFWALFVLVSFMDLFDDVQQNKVKGIVVLHYYAFNSPQILHLITPVAVLVSVLITFGILAPAQRDHRHEGGGHQHLPRHAAGAGPGHAGRALGMFALAEYVLPP